MFLIQKIPNVLTSGFFLNKMDNQQSVISSATTSIHDLLLSSHWKKCFHLFGNAVLYAVFTKFSVFYALDANHTIQLAGPPMYLPLTRTQPSQSTISLSAIYYRLSFSKTPGFTQAHLFSQLLQLNQAINRIEPNSPPVDFAYKTIRNEIALILLHHVFKECYTKWKTLDVKREMEELRIRYHFQIGFISRQRIPFSPRLDKCKVELGKLLHNVSRCCLPRLLNEYTPLPSAYVEYKQKLK